MIIRNQAGTHPVIVTQTDHSQLVGQVAAHWGNDRFERPRPYDAVVRAATFHDYGWLPYETKPRIDPASGKPYGFLQVPLKRPQLDYYQWGLDWIAGLDPYAGLLVNMHRTGLWKKRYGTIEHPVGYNLKDPSPEVAQFIAQNEQTQERARPQYDGAELSMNYRLLQVWDLLGLYFCCQEVKEDYIAPVPFSYGDSADAGANLRLTPESPTRVVFDPFPFDVKPVRIQLRYKELPADSFADDESFRRAYFGARNRMIEFELV